MWWVLAFTGIALAVYTFIDVLRSEDYERARLPRIVWLPLVVLLPIVGPLGWLIISGMQRAEYNQAARRQAKAAQAKRSASSPWATPRDIPRPGRRAPRTVAPDDDPEFLAKLAKSLGNDGTEEEPPKDAKSS